MLHQDTLFEAISQGNLKNAYLLTCSSIREAAAVAEQAILRLFCADRSGCETCGGCRKVLNGNCVDLLNIQEEGETVKLEDVEEIPDFIAKKAFEADRKCVYIPNAGRMNQSAQNFLLKSIEEPPEDVVFFLTARTENELLSTIVSRCICIQLEPMDRKELASLLTKEGIPLIKAQVLAKQADGYLREALALAQDEEFDHYREQAIGVCQKLCQAKGYAVTGMADMLLEQEDKLLEEIQIMESFFRDLLWQRVVGDTQGLIHIDKKNEIKRLADCFTSVQLHNMIEILGNFYERKQACRASNNRLQVMSMLFAILEVKLNGSCNRSTL